MVVGCPIDAGGSDIHEHYLCIPLKSQSFYVLKTKTKTEQIYTYPIGKLN